MQTYHYRNDLSPNGWTPFCLTEEDGNKWNVFCQRLSLSGQQPYFADYLTFLNELKIERTTT